MSDTFGTPSNSAFGGAAQNVDQQKAASLQAAAQGGATAQQAFTTAQAQNQAAMHAAVQRALAQSVNANAPAGTIPQASVQAPFAAAGATLGQGAENRANFFGNMGTIQGNYMDAIKAALPAIQGMYATRIAGIQQKNAQAAQDRAATLAYRQASLAARAGKAAPTAAQDLNKQTGGVTQSQNLIDQLADQGGYDQLKAQIDAGQGGNPMALLTGDTTGGLAQVMAQRDTLIQSIADQTGIDPALVQTYLDSADTREATQQRVASRPTTTPGVPAGLDPQKYASADADWNATMANLGKTLPGAKAPVTMKDIYNAIDNKYGPDIANSLLSKYSKAGAL